MKSYIKIVLLVLLFPTCSVGGYFIGKIINEFQFNVTEEEVFLSESVVNVTPEQDKVTDVVDSVVTSEVNEIEEATPVVFIPEIISVTSPVRDAAGKYSFEVKAVSADEAPLNYVLYSDKECTKLALHQNSNIFNGVEPTGSGTYYLVVINAISGQPSEVKTIKGFTRLVMYEKVKKEDLQAICNSGDYTKAPDRYSHRFSPSLVIEASGVRPGEKPVTKISEICDKVYMEQWKSVVVENLEYDSQNRVKKLVILVNY